MTMLGIAGLWIAGAMVVAAAGLRLRKVFGSISLKTQRQRVKGVSVFDLHLIVGGAATRPKREAALYVTLKTLPPEPVSPAKLLFEQKVRRLGE